MGTNTKENDNTVRVKRTLLTTDIIFSLLLPSLIFEDCGRTGAGISGLANLCAGGGGDGDL